jgi:hypothetical protein
MRTVLCTVAGRPVAALLAALAVVGVVASGGSAPARAAGGVRQVEQTSTTQVVPETATVPVEIIDAVAFVRDADGGVRRYR